MKFQPSRKGTTKSDSSQNFAPNWRNIVFLAPIYLIAIVGWPLYYFNGGGLDAAELGIAFFMYLVSILSIGVGYHRGMSHRAYKMSPVLRLLCLLGGSSTGEGSALSWCSDHRRHHRYEDTPKDPYNVNRSFWWAHMGWLLGSPTTTEFSNCRDMEKHWIYRFQHDYYILWFVVTSFIFPLIIGAFFGRPLAALLFAGFLRLFVVQQFTFCINSYAHYFGRRPYSKKITARDSLICALMAGGEGWHNFHHRFPFDYRNGHRYYHWDPVKWTILIAHKMGFVSNLKQAQASVILKACVETQKDLVEEPSPAMAKLAQSMDQALKRWQQLSFELSEKKEKRAAEFDQKVQQLKTHAEEARREFRKSYAEWRVLFRENMRLKKSAATA